MKKHYDVCVAGFWYGANYGSLLNGYAEYCLLKEFGKEVLMLQKPNAQQNDPEITVGHNVNFVKRYYDSEDVSPALPYDRLWELNDICDCFCAGSDQIWNHSISFSENMYLPFVKDDKKIISFATSFGHKNDKVPLMRREVIGSYLRRYSAISVREQFDVDILKDNYGISGTLVFEPVFCIDKRYYLELIENAKFNETEPYLLTYILDPTPEKREAILYYQEKLGIKVVNILDGKGWSWQKNKEMLNLPNIIENVETEDFLKAFMNSSYVITDSFHGSAFSIIFNKPFLAIGNYGRGYERFIDLLGRLQLMDRLVSDPKNIPHDEKYLKDIDYSVTNQIIEKEAKRTIEWLKNAVNTPKEKMESIIIANPVKKETPSAVDILYNNSDFIKIRILATLLRDYGVKHIVLSPGGRDVPLVRMFEYNSDYFILHSVTDERSAAYFGLGIAAQLKQPVVCVCTSGTAASNYLPAVTEAYYTGIPLIVVTADRREVYLNHGEDQTIPQKNIYNGVVKKAVSLPEGAGYNAEYQTRRDIADCILESTHNGLGPVHINISIENINIGANVAREYWKILPHRINPHILRVGVSDGEKKMMSWVNALKNSKRILIVYGQNSRPSEKQKQNIELFASKYNCVIVTDFISNLDCAYSLKPHNMLNLISAKEFNEQLSPDILITVGGKRLMNDPLTAKIRGGRKDIRHWSVTPDGKIKDFYFRLTSVVEVSQDYFFEWFANHAGDIINDGVYYGKWRELTEKYPAPTVTTFDAHYVQSKFIPAIPANSILHLGVGQSFYNCRRYTMNKSVEVFCNMGTNGIDGCTSTFLGQCAVVHDKLCFLLVGDLSFFYDMNSIWNKQLGKNVRILLVNNNGTGLLRGHRLKNISSVHNTTAKGWVESTEFEYISASSKEEFDSKLNYFLSTESQKPLFFEILCE